MKEARKRSANCPARPRSCRLTWPDSPTPKDTIRNYIIIAKIYLKLAKKNCHYKKLLTRILMRSLLFLCSVCLLISSICLSLSFSCFRHLMKSTEDLRIVPLFGLASLITSKYLQVKVVHDKCNAYNAS